MKRGIVLSSLFIINISRSPCDMEEIQNVVCAQIGHSTDAWIVVHQSITVKVAVSHNIELAVSIMFQNDG